MKKKEEETRLLKPHSTPPRVRTKGAVYLDSGIYLDPGICIRVIEYTTLTRVQCENRVLDGPASGGKGCKGRN